MAEGGLMLIDSESTDSESVGKLSGGLGTWDIVFTVLAYNAPLTTVIAVIPLIVSLGNGLSTPLALTGAAGLMMLFAVGFTAMTKHIQNGGAYYTYIASGLGRSAGLGGACIAILSYFFFLVGAYLYMGDVLTRLLVQLGSPLHTAGAIWTVAAIVCVAILGYLRVSLSAKLLTAALLLEVVLVVAWEIAIGRAVGFHGLSSQWLFSEAHSRTGSFGIGILLAVTCFAGFEATAVFRDEARNPDVTVPRGTYLSILLMGALFATAAYFFIVGFGPQHVGQAVSAEGIGAPLTSIHQYLGAAGIVAVEVLMVSSIFACILAVHNILARYVFSLARDGLLPARLATIHGRHGSPHWASMVVSAASLSVVGILLYRRVNPYDTYAEMVGMAGYVLLLLQILTSLAVISFFHTHRRVSVWQSTIAPIASCIALSWTLWVATVHIDVVAGESRSAQVILIGIYVLLGGGAAWAQILRRRAPHVYERIGREALT